jgi:hypothetical protein
MSNVLKGSVLQIKSIAEESISGQLLSHFSVTILTFL